MDDYNVPNPFDFDMHLSAITTDRHKRQLNSKKIYVLFILDYSGTHNKFTIHYDEKCVSILWQYCIWSNELWN